MSDEWQEAIKADGTPFTMADLDKAIAECDPQPIVFLENEPEHVTRKLLDEFERDENKILTRELHELHQDNCPARRMGSCNCGMSR